MDCFGAGVDCHLGYGEWVNIVGNNFSSVVYGLVWLGGNVTITNNQFLNGEDDGTDYAIDILTSNDGDYVSAVETARNTFGKIINVAYFKEGLSMNLLRICSGRRKLKQSYFQRLSFTI